MTYHDPVCIDSAIQDGCGLRVAFVWQADRYAHQVQYLVDGRAAPLLISVEGTVQQRWPPSPPFQQLSVEDRVDGSRVALLVGMAGKSHWSASIQATSDAPRIKFDVACLAREFPQRVGSSYGVEVPPGHDGGEQLGFCLASGHWARLKIERLENEPAGQLQSEGSQIAITRPHAEKSPPMTIRWLYTVEMVRQDA